MEIAIKYLSYLVIFLFVLVMSTNCIVQVIKDITLLKEIPTKIVATIIGLTLTIATAIAICEIFNIYLTWYIISGSIVLGFYTAFGAINGFDSLYGKYLDKLKSVILKEKER